MANRLSRNFLLFFFLSIGLSTLAQHKPVLKLYGHFALYGASSVPIIDQPSNDVLDFRWVSPALHFERGKGVYHEFELTNFMFQSVPDASTDTRFSIGLKYERGRRFGKREHNSMVFRGGVSVKTYLGLEQLTAANPNGLPTENRVFGIALGINPHLEYRLSRQLVFDFSPYCELINVAARSEHVFDDAIDEEQRQSVDFFLWKLNCFFRFGLGWRF